MNKVERSNEKSLKSSSHSRSESDSEHEGVDHTYNPYKFKNFDRVLFDKKFFKQPKTQNFIQEE